MSNGKYQINPYFIKTKIRPKLSTAAQTLQESQQSGTIINPTMITYQFLSTKHQPPAKMNKPQQNYEQMKLKSV